MYLLQVEESARNNAQADMGGCTVVLKEFLRLHTNWQTSAVLTSYRKIFLLHFGNMNEKKTAKIGKTTEKIFSNLRYVTN